MLSNFSLQGKYALITGSTGLLGRQHCFALAEVNCNLIITDINLESLIELRLEVLSKFSNIEIHCLKMDVTQESEITNILTFIKKNIQRIDILINNAAINPSYSKDNLSNSSRLENLEISEWHRQISVGLTGAFLCIKHFGALMKEYGNGGVILNIASDLSVIAPDQRLYYEPGKAADVQDVKPVTYSVVKTGLIGLTRYVSTYWSKAGIRCNALSPGGIFTGQPEEFVERIKKRIPLGRMAERDEYKSTVQFLCSDASIYMTGQNIVIDGGRSVW